MPTKTQQDAAGVCDFPSLFLFLSLYRIAYSTACLAVSIVNISLPLSLFVCFVKIIQCESEATPLFTNPHPPSTLSFSSTRKPTTTNTAQNPRVPHSLTCCNRFLFSNQIQAWKASWDVLPNRRWRMSLEWNKKKMWFVIFYKRVSLGRWGVQGINSFPRKMSLEVRGLGLAVDLALSLFIPGLIWFEWML